MKHLDDVDSCSLGQFMPTHYQENRLMESARMAAYKAAILYATAPGARVLELGGGTGVLSWFAAAKAERVYCVEQNADMALRARALLDLNRCGHKVEVVHANAFDYLPPEPVDLVICEMAHAGLLREPQLELIASFKRRYRARFGGPMPRFLPEAHLLAVQPLQQDYDFAGFRAPIVQLQTPGLCYPGTLELAAPQIYRSIDQAEASAPTMRWDGCLTPTVAGTLNALRFVTKNILAIVQEHGSCIDQHCPYLVLPLERAVTVRPGESLRLAFQYRAGASIASLQRSLRLTRTAAASTHAVPLARRSAAPVSLAH